VVWSKAQRLKIAMRGELAKGSSIGSSKQKEV